MLTLLPDIRKEMISRLIGNYRKPATSLILSAIAKEFTELDLAIIALNDAFFIDKAVGAFLDIVGKLVVEERQGRDDDEYRQAIVIKNAINQSAGTPGNIITAVKAIIKPFSIKYTEVYPAGIHVYVRASENIDKLRIVVDTIAPLGVETDISYSENVPFVFSEIQSVSDLVKVDLNSYPVYNTIVIDNTEQDGEGFAEAIYKPDLFDIGDGRVLALDDNGEILLGLETEDYYDDFEIDESYGGEVVESV